MTYDSYKNEVLIKTTGANIHNIRDQLGIIINSISHYKFRKKISDEKECERMKNIIEHIILKIYKETKVTTTFEELIDDIGK